MSTAVAWFDVSDLYRLAGDASFWRGVRYLPAVRSIDDVPGGVVATVRGTDVYTVRLGRDGEELTGECTCPYGAQGAFCKHCVAVGLLLIEDGPALAELPALRRYLLSLARDDLVGLLLRHAAQYPDLYRELALRATGGLPSDRR